MKKIACPLLIVLLSFALSVTVSAEKETWDRYAEWKYDTIYDAYSGGYDEGYSDGKNECEETHTEIEIDAFSRGAEFGKAIMEAKYCGFVPWWTNIIVFSCTLIICIFLTWIFSKLKIKRK